MGGRTSLDHAQPHCWATVLASEAPAEAVEDVMTNAHTVFLSMIITSVLVCQEKIASQDPSLCLQMKGFMATGDGSFLSTLILNSPKLTFLYLGTL